MDRAVFTLIGRRSDGASPAVDVVDVPSLSAARQRAKAFLADHSSCELVEIYLDGEKLDVLRRSAEELAG